MKLKNLIKTAEKWSKKIGKPVTIYLPPGKVNNEQITLKKGIQLAGLTEK
jgi:hypothetical protein